MFIVDAHLDLSYNALKGRDVLRPAAEQPPEGNDIPTVGLPDLRAGGVGLICATIFCLPASPEDRVGYHTPQEAQKMGRDHLDWYQKHTEAGDFKLITSAAQIQQLQDAKPDRAQPAILLLEGADPLLDEADVQYWYNAGLRIVGLAWRRTRLAGGTGAPGPLTAEGRKLVGMLDRLGIIHDTSHLAEESFWDLIEVSTGPIMASHSNCRSIVPGDRHLSDSMIRVLFKRDGVIGINFFDKFLLPPDQYGQRRATLGDVVAHVRHMCDLAGDAGHVGLGTDMDGGLGRNEIPREIQTSVDLPRVADALASAGFDDAAIAGIMGKNWLDFFARSLPQT